MLCGRVKGRGRGCGGATQRCTELGLGLGGNQEGEGELEWKLGRGLPVRQCDAMRARLRAAAGRGCLRSSRDSAQERVGLIFSLLPSSSSLETGSHFCFHLWLGRHLHFVGEGLQLWPRVGVVLWSPFSGCHPPVAKACIGAKQAGLVPGSVRSSRTPWGACHPAAWAPARTAGQHACMDRCIPTSRQCKTTDTSPLQHGHDDVRGRVRNLNLSF